MTKRNILQLLLMVVMPTVVIAQQPENPEKITVKVSGFVKAETFFDTYRSVDSRDGELYLYPLAANIDSEGKDINKVTQFEMLGLQSRFRITASGTTIFGAKASSFLEGDFLGTTQDDRYELRLRHAIVKLDWPKTQLIAGQYWHPMSMPEIAPNTVLFAAGISYFTLNRSAQIRLTQNIGTDFKIMGAVVSPSYHRVTEPNGTNTQRNAGIPEVQSQFFYGNAQTTFVALTAGYKFIRPALTSSATGNTYKATKNVGSYNLQLSFLHNFPKISWRVQGNLGENMTNYVMIGGYGLVKGSENAKGEYDYANMLTGSAWTDFETRGQKVKFGLFAGYTENFGTKEDIVFVGSSKNDFCRSADLKYHYRISPRMYVNAGAVELGFEYMMAKAVYGQFVDRKIVNTQDPTTNHRFMTTVRYSF